MSINFNDKRVPRIYQGSNLVYENTNSESEVIQDGLLLHYDFKGKSNEDGNRDVIEDLSGNGNHGTLHNFNFNNESGYTEEGLKFDGEDDYITLANIIELPAQSDWTIELYISPDYNTTNYNTMINFSHPDYSSSSGGLEFSGSNFLFSRDSTSGNSGARYTQEGHSNLPFVFSVVQNGELIESLINGEDINTSNTTGKLISNKPSVMSSINGRISSDEIVHYGGAKYILHSVRVYNKALTKREIKYNYNTELGIEEIEIIPQKAILIGNTNIARIMQGNELIWGESYSPSVDEELEEEN